MTPFPGPAVGLRPNPSHGPGVGRVRATIIGQGTVSDRAGAAAIALNGQNADPSPILHRTRIDAVAYEGMIGIGGTHGTRTPEIQDVGTVLLTRMVVRIASGVDNSPRWFIVAA
jgi:hypothetical protein